MIHQILDLHLYTAAAMYGYKPVIFLVEAGLSYELIFIDFSKQEQSMRTEAVKSQCSDEGLGMPLSKRSICKKAFVPSDCARATASYWF